MILERKTMKLSKASLTSEVLKSFVTIRNLKSSVTISLLTSSVTRGDCSGIRSFDSGVHRKNCWYRILRRKLQTHHTVCGAMISSRTEIEVDVPASVAYDCYSDRERIPEWMPFISSVKVLKDKPDLSRWSLKYEVFGQNVEFSWLARNMQPIPNQKIHWRSLEGLPNKGAVRFFPKSPSSCRIELTTSYEVPDILVPVASALKPFTEGLLYRGLEKFSTFAKKYYKKEASPS